MQPYKFRRAMHVERATALRHDLHIGITPVTWCTGSVKLVSIL
jgi:hypothetical protein